jgi:hypothetical protein
VNLFGCVGTSALAVRIIYRAFKCEGFAVKLVCFASQHMNLSGAKRGSLGCGEMEKGLDRCTLQYAQMGFVRSPGIVHISCEVNV